MPFIFSPSMHHHFIYQISDDEVKKGYLIWIKGCIKISLLNSRYPKSAKKFELAKTAAKPDFKLDKHTNSYEILL